jgi:hypothetical protein
MNIQQPSAKKVTLTDTSMPRNDGIAIDLGAPALMDVLL